MPIPPFEMERMQSTWENLVDYDMSESGVRPLTLRELAAMGFDLESLPRRAARLQPVERHDRAARADRGALSGRERRPRRSHQRHLGSQLPRRAEPAPARRRRRDGGAELHADAGRRAQPGRRGQDVRAAARTRLGAGLGRVRARRHAADAAALPVEPEQSHRRGAVGRRDAAHRRSLRRRPARGSSPTRSTWAPRSTRAADEELLGAGRSRDRDERPVEGVRDSRRPDRLDRRSAGAGGRRAGRSTTT